MAIIGSQHQDTDKGNLESFQRLISFTIGSPEECKPKFVDYASVVDPQDAYNQCVIAYWPSVQLYQQWSDKSGFENWWNSLDAEKEKHGWFLEVFFPPLERFETVFSDNEVPEGAAHMRESVSGPMLEHVYWGSMRDRLPLSQTDKLVGEKQDGSKEDSETLRHRVRVPGKSNLAVIRSGQDWSNTYPEERKLYLDTMHPVLIKGMNFLRDEGDEVGCYECRFMKVSDPKTMQTDTDKTFGLAYFDDLASLEGWSKEHKTHLDIFGGFLQYAKKLNNNISLRLFHEVLVLEPEQQTFEYVNCHAQSGMLRSLKVPS